MRVEKEAAKKRVTNIPVEKVFMLFLNESLYL